ncbi:hypothetical protein KAH81_08300 [bacterium]|nr:hypothetical protein [bacterium]
MMKYFAFLFLVSLASSGLCIELVEEETLAMPNIYSNSPSNWINISNYEEVIKLVNEDLIVFVDFSSRMVFIIRTDDYKLFEFKPVPGTKSSEFIIPINVWTIEDTIYVLDFRTKRITKWVFTEEAVEFIESFFVGT